MGAGPILVIDDDEAICDFLEISLTEEGYKVVAARDGAQGLRLLEENRPGLVMLDLNMPVLNGWGFLAAYSKMPGPHSPVIVMSAANNSARVNISDNVVDFVAKPFNLDSLISLIARYVPQ